jgi:hypothetical protein
VEGLLTLTFLLSANSTLEIIGKVFEFTFTFILSESSTVFLISHRKLESN